MDYSKSFYDLFVWKKAHELVLYVYRATNSFPDFERFGLRSQFTRAAVSIPANIAEGYKKYQKQINCDSLTFLKEVWKNANIIFFSQKTWDIFQKVNIQISVF